MHALAPICLSVCLSWPTIHQSLFLALFWWLCTLFDLVVQFWDADVRAVQPPAYGIGCWSNMPTFSDGHQLRIWLHAASCTGVQASQTWQHKGGSLGSDTGKRASNDIARDYLNILCWLPEHKAHCKSGWTTCDNQRRGNIVSTGEGQVRNMEVRTEPSVNCFRSKYSTAHDDGQTAVPRHAWRHHPTKLAPVQVVVGIWYCVLSDSRVLTGYPYGLLWPWRIDMAGLYNASAWNCNNNNKKADYVLYSETGPPAKDFSYCQSRHVRSRHVCSQQTRVLSDGMAALPTSVIQWIMHTNKK